MTLPAPLVPADVDLRDFGYMPLDVLRLRDSDMAALSNGEQFKAAVLLWCAAWHQVPAASLPDDDRLLARYSGAGQAWKKLRVEALRGFVKCSDGRLYHATIAEKAVESWDAKLKQRERTKNATEARDAKRREQQIQRDVQRNVEHDVDRNVPRDEPRDVQRNVVQGKVREGKGSKGIEKNPPTPLWGRPDWVPEEPWAEFELMRKAMRSVPFTDAARAGVVRELQKLVGMGHDAGECLRNAVTNGWRSVYPPKPMLVRRASDDFNAEENAKAKRILGIAGAAHA